MKQQDTPPSGTASTFTSTPGKTQKALPAPESRSFFDDQYEVEEVDDMEVEMARRI